MLEVLMPGLRVEHIIAGLLGIGPCVHQAHPSDANSSLTHTDRARRP